MANLVMTRLKGQERGQQAIVKFVVEKPKGLALLAKCVTRMLVFSVKNAVAFL